MIVARPRRRRLRRPCFLALAVLAAALRPAGVPPPALAGEIDDLRQQAEQLIDELQRELDAVRAERRSLEAERSRLEEERKALEAERTPEEGSAPTVAEAPTEADRKVSILAAEVERLKETIVLPESKEYKSYYGLGPAASKIYQMNRGLSIGGYGEANFSGTVTDRDQSKNTADLLRFVLYTGYKFTDRLLLNAEIEIEHATTEETASSDDGSVSVEFAYLDYLASDPFNLRGGLFLVPLGFINEIHEPVFFYGVHRPEVELRIIPTTWRELGVGAFGNLHPDLAYRAYLSTSLNAEGFDSDGIRDGRQQGSEALAEDPAGSMRLDYTPHQVPGLLIGASAFLGDTGEDQDFDGHHPNAFLTLWDVHAQYRYRGLSLRALAAFGNLDDAGTLSRAAGETIADRFEGWYAEAGYDIMPYVQPSLSTQSLEPFFRYEHFDTQAGVPQGFVRDLGKEVDLYTLGVMYKPHPQVALKLDYRNFVPRRGSRPNDVNIGLGFIF